MSDLVQAVINKRYKGPDPDPEEEREEEKTTKEEEKKPANAVKLSTASDKRKILVNKRQKDNPILKFVAKNPIEFAKDDCVADFVMSDNIGVIFISIRYHKVNPEYLYTRMEPCKRFFKLRIVLGLVDDVDCESALLKIHSSTVANGFTVVLCWSSEEGAKYLESLKSVEMSTKSTEAIEEKLNTEYQARVVDVMTKVKGVNKTDVKTLLRNFNSLQGILGASMENLSLCSGIGEKKVLRMYACFNDEILKPKPSESDLKKTNEATVARSAVEDDEEEQQDEE